MRQRAGSAKLLKCSCIVILAVAGWLLPGCLRQNESDFDNRTLEKKPVVETVKPDSRRDPFRP
jgi:hypothetical protein